ncbi:MAG: FkbM family methyltransferase [Desulfuromusa sp.]|nr:FkbM family methyltransferase [Desulfuromusa sp.]
MHFAHLVKRLANRCGFDIQRLSSQSKIRTTLNASYSHMHKLGLRPKTVTDVGVAQGTSELYINFPDAYYLLIEPLVRFEPDLKKNLRKYKGSYVLAAAGKCSGQVTFNVHDSHLEGSSLYKESMGESADGHEITVSVLPIDTIVRDKKLSAPFFIKVDVQGAELDVLDGCKSILKDTEAIALEVSMFQFMRNSPQFHEVIFYMKQRGFVTFDIIPGWNRPLDDALGQVDIIFVKENGKFRQTHAYATDEQLRSIFGN